MVLFKSIKNLYQKGIQAEPLIHLFLNSKKLGTCEEFNI